MLVASGIHLIKLWFLLTQGEQRTWFTIRQIDPVRQSKLSPTDLASLDKWEDCTGRQFGNGSGRPGAVTSGSTSHRRLGAGTHLEVGHHSAISMSRSPGR